MTGRPLHAPGRGWLLALALLLLSGCATPVGVVSLGNNYGYEQIDQSALNSRKLSSFTAAELHRRDLQATVDDSPTDGLIKLHQLACADNSRDSLFALAELAFQEGQRGRGRTVAGVKLTADHYFAAAAVYAYLFLERLAAEESAAAFDRRFRLACDLYNRSLGYVVAHHDQAALATERVLALPVGTIRVQKDAANFARLQAADAVIAPADCYKIRGLSVRNRVAGLGAPIVITQNKRLKYGSVPASSAATLFLRVHGGIQDFAPGNLRGDLELYSAATTGTVEVAGRPIPLEQDLTAPIAVTLNNPIYWQIEKSLFRLGQSAFEPGIYPSHPYQPGKIPVLWVHGTMSSPVWWAEMWNTLMGDQELRENYQHWFYLYDSGKPILQSAVQFRAAVEAMVKQLDPAGKDPALRQMVVIGHSQGGLLTKLTAVETGDRLLRAATGKTIAELQLDPADEQLVRSHIDLAPLPEVKRVVFIATPHHGSFLASKLVRRLAKWFIQLPRQAVQTTAQFVRLAPKAGLTDRLATTSLDTMAPDNPGLLALAAIPVSPPIKAHSIIAIKGDDQPPAGDDGVVEYRSAHLAGVESELVVRSGHSCQGQPATIEEVRRILHEHLAAVRSPAP